VNRRDFMKGAIAALGAVVAAPLTLLKKVAPEASPFETSALGWTETPTSWTTGSHAWKGYTGSCKMKISEQTNDAFVKAFEQEVKDTEDLYYKMFDLEVNRPVGGKGVNWSG